MTNKENKESEKIEEEETYDTLAPAIVPQGKRGGTAGFAQIAISLIMALIVSWSMVSMLTVSKKVYQADITRLENDLVVARQNNTDLTNQLNALNNNLANNYATRSSVDSLANLPNTIDSKISSLSSSLTTTINNDLTEQDAKIAALEARIAELEEEAVVESDVDPEDAVEIDVRYYGTYVVTIDPECHSLISVPVKLKLNNQLAVNIQDIVLSARITLRSTTGSLMVHDANLIGDIEWYPYGTNSFESWSDIKLKASAKESYNLTFSANVANTHTAESITSIIISMKFGCEEYEIVS